MDETINKLKRACDDALTDPNLRPLGDKTYCNVAVDRICSVMGYNGFDGLLANDIYDLCLKTWSKTTDEWANEYACSGNLAIAAQKNLKGHGHAAVLYPGPMAWSKKWNSAAPLVANIGKENKICGANFAFVEKPDYFILKKT